MVQFKTQKRLEREDHYRNLAKQKALQTGRDETPQTRQDQTPQIRREPQTRRDQAPQTRRYETPQTRRDQAPQARRDEIPQARRDESEFSQREHSLSYQTEHGSNFPGYLSTYSEDHQGQRNHSSVDQLAVSSRRDDDWIERFQRFERFEQFQRLQSLERVESPVLEEIYDTQQVSTPPSQRYRLEFPPQRIGSSSYPIAQRRRRDSPEDSLKRGRTRTSSREPKRQDHRQTSSNHCRINSSSHQQRTGSRQSSTVHIPASRDYNPLPRPSSSLPSIDDSIQHHQAQITRLKQERAQLVEQESIKQESVERERVEQERVKRERVEQERMQLVEKERTQLVEQKRMQLVEKERTQLVEQERMRLVEQERMQLIEERTQLVEQKRMQLIEQERMQLIEQERMRLIEEKMQLVDQERMQLIEERKQLVKQNQKKMQPSSKQKESVMRVFHTSPSYNNSLETETTRSFSARPNPASSHSPIRPSTASLSPIDRGSKDLQEGNFVFEVDEGLQHHLDDIIQDDSDCTMSENGTESQLDEVNERNTLNQSLQSGRDDVSIPDTSNQTVQSQSDTQHISKRRRLTRNPKKRQHKKKKKQASYYSLNRCKGNKEDAAQACLQAVENPGRLIRALEERGIIPQSNKVLVDVSR